MPDIDPPADEKTTIANPAEASKVLLSDDHSSNKISLTDDELAKIPEREKVYGRSMLATFSFGMVDPFLTTIAYDVGATGSQMGWLRALTNLLGNFVQPIFGYLSDKIQRRSIFVAISNILYSSIWILLLFVNNVLMIIIIASILALAVSLGTPAWTALLGEVIPIKIRGKIISNVNWFSQIPYILSTILGGILFNYITGVIKIGSWSLPSNYFYPILLGLIAGFASSFVIFSFKEKTAIKRAQKMNKAYLQQLKQSSEKDKIVEESCVVDEAIIADMDPQSIVQDGTEVVCVSDDTSKEESQEDHPQRFKAMFQNKDFMRFTLVFSIQSFFMSMCWPLFPIRQRGDIGADFLEIAIFSVVMSLATLVTIRYAGQVSDLIGRKPQMFLNRLILIAMPLGYMFASQVWHIIVMHALICIPLGLNSAVMQAYLIDITPDKERSTYVGFFNMVWGLILFAGSLFGGYLVDFLMGEVAIFGYTPAFDQYMAVTIAFAVGFVGRLITAMPFLTLREVKAFPYKLKDLPRLVLNSRKLFPLLMSVSFYFGFIFIFMGIMGYLP